MHTLRRPQGRGRERGEAVGILREQHRRHADARRRHAQARLQEHHLQLIGHRLRRPRRDTHHRALPQGPVFVPISESAPF